MNALDQTTLFIGSQGSGALASPVENNRSIWPHRS